MLSKFALSMVVIAGTASLALAQANSTRSGSPAPKTWQTAGGGSTAVTAASANSPRPNQPTDSATQARTSAAKVSTGSGALPNDHGQLWREYDITPYTLRVTSTARPEQAIVDWILRETGYEAWHSEPLGILSANQRTLRVYHTAEMQATVADIVDRFVSSEADTQTFGLRVVTVNHPNWRARAQQLLKPISVQTPGVQAWLVEKEDAARLMAELRRRNDFREHSSPHLMVNNGQSSPVSATRSRSYIRSVSSRPDAWPGFEPETAFVDEGFSLEFTPLLSVDGNVIDATIKCNIDQVEKMIPVMLDVPTVVAPRQRTKIEVPQLAHFRFHERFRWPAEQVLLVGMGMVAVPVPSDAKSLVSGIRLSLTSSNAPRADLLVFVESKVESRQSPRVTRATPSEATTYRGRY
jgi:hypothetical protein